MGFNDHPKVDNNSKRSEESVNTLRLLFSRKNGFLFREEQPDYGVDVDVELILDGQNASSWKFAIQIKSKEKLKITTENDEQLVSFSFDVSRIGYLARRAPTYGLIVGYDEEKQESYYGYVEEIVARLDNHPNRSGWREQDSTTILFPPTKITKDEVANIHRKMVTRHENNTKMISEQGKNFGIPSLQYATSNPVNIDFKDTQSIQSFLTKYGTYLFNQNEFKLLTDLLSKLSQSAVLNDVNLSFLSAITFTQMGNVSDAEYYLRKLNKRSGELSDEQRGILKFSEVRISFLKGDVDYKEFLNQLTTIKTYVKDPENLLTIEINELFFQLNEKAVTSNFEVDAIDRIDNLTEKIKKADITESKRQLLLVYHAENIQSYSLEAFLHFHRAYKMRESLKIDVPVDARAAYANLTVSMNKLAIDTALAAYKFAEENDFRLLRASAAQNLGKFFFNLNYYLIMQGINDEPVKDIESVKRYEVHQNYSIIAYNEFRSLNMLQNAHEALTNAYELNYLSSKMLFTEIGTLKADDLMNIIRNIEEEADLQPFQSAARILVEGTIKRKTNGPTIMADLTEDGIDFLAKNALTAYGLPSERLENIKAELRVMQTFESRCKNPNIELRFNNEHHLSNTTRYSKPPKFLIAHKNLKWESEPSTDIDALINKYKSSLQ